MALKEKLERLRNPRPAPDAASRVSEWQDAVRHLLDEIETWLAAYVSQGLMQPKRHTVDIEEDGLGRYSTERLDIDLGGGETLVFLPVGLDVAGAAGRVDMFRAGHQSDGYRLLRATAVERASWDRGDAAGHAEGASGNAWVLWHEPSSLRQVAWLPEDWRWLRLGTPLSGPALEKAIDSLLG